MTAKAINDAIKAGLHYSFEVLRDIRENNSSSLVMKQSKKELKVEPVDPNVDLVKQALERNIKRHMDAALTQKEEFNMKKNESVISVCSTEVKNPSVEKQTLVLFQKKEQVASYTEKASSLIANPNNKCQIGDPTMTYFKNCNKMQIKAEPIFVNLIKDNVLRIQNDFLSLSHC